MGLLSDNTMGCVPMTPWARLLADGMVITHLPYGPSAYFGIYNTVLRHDIGQKKEVSMT